MPCVQVSIEDLRKVGLPRLSMRAIQCKVRGGWEPLSKRTCVLRLSLQRLPHVSTTTLPLSALKLMFIVTNVPPSQVSSPDADRHIYRAPACDSLYNRNLDPYC
eukprot:gb/GEZJ01003929.1/.p2 GENE.gb/GEZJ01003929.1/~~gb/GEZJ01003929.1/.p2  ORF type:complete len:118 (-),score=0.79 gb/GEZJ01003929.1/:458-769(-)